MILKIEKKNQIRTKNEQLLNYLHRSSLQIFSPASINLEEFKILLAILFSEIALNSKNKNIHELLVLDLQKEYSFLDQKAIVGLLKLLLSLGIVANNNLTEKGFELLNYICLEETD